MKDIFERADDWKAEQFRAETRSEIMDKKNGVPWRAAIVILALAGALLAGVWAVTINTAGKAADSGERLAAVEASLPAIQREVSHIRAEQVRQGQKIDLILTRLPGK